MIWNKSCKKEIKKDGMRPKTARRIENKWDKLLMNFGVLWEMNKKTDMEKMVIKGKEIVIELKEWW